MSAPTPASQIGIENYLYLNESDPHDYDTPDWTEINRARSVTTGLSKGQADTSRRQSKYRLQRGALRELTLSFEYVYKNGGTDTLYDALLDSWINGTPLDLLVLDDEVTVDGATGWRAYYEVFSFERTEELEGAVIHSAELMPVDVEDDAGTLLEPARFEVEVGSG